LLPAGAVATEVYKWVDENGKVHYGDRPAGSQSEKVEVKATPPTQDHDAPAREERTRKLLDQLSDERAEQEKQQAERAEEAAKRKQECALAKKRLENYRNAGYLYKKDKNAERQILSNEERAAAEAEAQKIVDQWCKPEG
jgi:hypothetical protein